MVSNFAWRVFNGKVMNWCGPTIAIVDMTISTMYLQKAVINGIMEEAYEDDT